MPETQLLLAQAFKATDFSYPDVEGAIASSCWEKELLLPRTAPVQQAPAQPAAHTPASPRQQTGLSKQHGDPDRFGRRQCWRGCPQCQGAEQCPGSPPAVMQKLTEEAAAPVTPSLGSGMPVPWQHPRCLSPAPYQLLEPEPGRAWPGDPGRCRTRNHPTACAEREPHL